MVLVIIFGPPAVGKMTVGLELEKLTGFPLFHNHVTVDPIVRLFEFGSPAFNRLVLEFRRRIFEEFAASDRPGLIFTFVWALDVASDRAFIDSTIEVNTELAPQTDEGVVQVSAELASGTRIERWCRCCARTC